MHCMEALLTQILITIYFFYHIECIAGYADVVPEFVMVHGVNR